MTELFTQKAVVNLPKRNRTSIIVSDERYTDYLVSDKLYIDNLPSFLTKDEIMDLLKTCDPSSIELETRDDVQFGYIQFKTRDTADRAFTLFNGLTFRSGHKLHLKISQQQQQQEPQSQILQIRNLPRHIDNNSALYDLFRPFGPMILCKILVEQDSTFKGSALVQYFGSEDAQNAIMKMDGEFVQYNLLSVYPFRRNNENATPASMIDYTNLYIKNLDLNVKSADLFDNFRKYGRIISARVMKNPQTKQSKGFGFVSFSKMDEAQQAKEEMNGVYILSKPVVVAFHEPKKAEQPRIQPPPRNPVPSHYMERRTSNSSHYHMAVDTRPGNTNHHNTIMDRRPSNTSHHNMSMERGPGNTNHYNMPMDRRPSNASHYMERQPNHIYEQRYYQPPKQIPLQRNISPSNYQPPPPQFQHTKPSFRRRGSIESVMTKTSSSTRRQTITNAVLSIENPVDDDIIDMLLTLKRKDLATCLFNKVFLKAKIKQAKDALAIFKQQQQKQETIEQETVDINEQKQALGDKLFPLVKATGVKHAPRVTIQLLDNIPLSDLANSMHDKDKLKNYIDKVLPKC